MEEILAHFPPEGSPKRLKRFRSTPSFTTSRSNSSAGSIPDTGGVIKLKTPVLRNRKSTSSVRSLATSDTEREIHAPVPRRPHLHVQATRSWLHTPSPNPSRANTPQSHKRQETSSQLSFKSLQEHDALIQLYSYGQVPGPEAKKVDEDEWTMGRRWVRWMYRHGMRDWVMPCVLVGSVWVKWAIGLGSYSGQGTLPMFGDYEAQRHWMELTIHLPVGQWYKYDLPYWGLDYPPLTAYHSWLCGLVGSWINPAWFALDKSRGIETPGSKIYMRTTVVAFDSLVYLPALLYFTHAWLPSRSRRTQNLALITMLLQPALLLIDFGHFQYNSIMLGFTLLALSCFAQGRDSLGAFFFVLSLGFKQMALYYAPAIGSYLIGKCIYLGREDGLRLFIRLAVVTSLSFIMLFLPFLPPFAPFSGILDPITRIFPFNRGLFEDKVANFWCASNVVFKWRSWLSRSALVRLSGGLTLLGFLPGAATLILGGLKTQLGPGEREKGDERSPTPILRLLPYALLTSSMSFFLFSFQVHEKTILLPLLPVTMLLSGASPDSGPFAWCALVNNVAVFSMWPLLKKDGLGIQYIATIILWNRVIGYKPFRIRDRTFVQLLSATVYVTLLILHVLEMVVTPPVRYPDLFPVLNVLVSTPVFVLTWLWSMKCGLQALWALGGLGSGISKSAAHKRNTTLSPIKEQVGPADGLPNIDTTGSVRKAGSVGRESRSGFTPLSARFSNSSAQSHRRQISKGSAASQNG